MSGMTDEKCLEAALKAEGYKVEVGTSLTINSGYGTSKVQIKLPKDSGAGNRYEAGFTKDKEGNLNLVKESMDYELNDDWKKKIKQSYTRQKAIQLARAKGLKLAQEVRKNGKISLVFNT